VANTTAVTCQMLHAGIVSKLLNRKCRDLEMGSKVAQGHCEWYHSIDCVWFPISVP